MFLGGDALEGPRHIWWNFVSSRKERIEQAKADWRARLDERVGLPAVLPALKRPTISHLSDEEWLAVNTILDESTVRDIIPRLKQAGAQGIVEYPLNKIVM